MCHHELTYCMLISWVHTLRSQERASGTSALKELVYLGFSTTAYITRLRFVGEHSNGVLPVVSAAVIIVVYLQAPRLPE